ncbi:cyclic lactone autoinducer peptide [Tepidibacter aestuarii]|nr:cyclic lactone autoinducer peptide [Tepidibacter aestuarii]CAH2213181.1 AgrD protein [Tepidibacter aestuarii]
MFKISKRKMISTLASILTLVVSTGVSTRSVWIYYEPDMPESLDK